MTPSPGSWAGARPAAGLRVVLLTMGEEASTETMTDAVRIWAREVGADLREVRAGAGAFPRSPRPSTCTPMSSCPPATASWIPSRSSPRVTSTDPNVLAVDWAGAGFRGEDLGQAAHHDPASFTPERCRDAVAAGVAALLSGQNGVVVWIP